MESKDKNMNEEVNKLENARNGTPRHSEFLADETGMGAKILIQQKIRNSFRNPKKEEKKRML